MLDKQLRYKVVEKLLKESGGKSILEVGAGTEGLSSCLPYRFVGIDPHYMGQPAAAQTAVQASAAALPFADRSFEDVICIEVMEHIPPELRAKSVLEMMRVSRSRVVITHPFGVLGKLGDYFMAGIYAMIRRTPEWMAEHLEFPYPNHKTYLPADLSGWNVTIAGQGNAFLHPWVVMFGNLKSVSRSLNKTAEHHPKRLRFIMALADFPPYSRRIVILERK